MIVAFIDDNRAEFGVEFICKHMQVAPSTYYAAKKRQDQPCARAVRDAVMMQVLLALWIANRKVYGAHKLWKAAHRAGHDIGRDQVARLMRELGIEGVSRLRKKVFTTRSDPDATRAPDLVSRQFKADRPDALWVTDLTYVPTRSGMAYVCFIVDAFSRRIVGWRAASNMKTEMVLDALEMARASRGGHRLVGLVTHSDAGSQFTSVRFTERLEEIGARPSIGTIADNPTTTRWPKRPTASTRPSAFTAPTAAAGTTSTSSNSRRCPGCTGSTRTASTGTAATCRRPNTKRRSTLAKTPTRSGLESNKKSLHQTQGDSVLPSDLPSRRRRAKGATRSPRGSGISDPEED
ncbi:hypothetical protein GCM10009547_48230 [Sporichthya brevicatena]|uniref:Integrase catalytic domain-containing protein n=1 Tax=Sporichthya brevicatena TaxID=171442 RepID=A0ABN1HCK0_9ACTN